MHWKIQRFDQVSSTQAIAKLEAQKRSPIGIVVVAESQTLGRGRKGRHWHSPTGGLYVSVILKPTNKSVLIPLTAGVAIAELINKQTGLKASLKWPNDVFIDDGKVAGIIAESVWIDGENEHTILGVGVNVNNLIPDNLRNATSLREKLGKYVNLELFLVEFLKKLDKWINLLNVDPNYVVDKWRSLSNTISKSVKIIDSNGEKIQGIAIDVDNNGALLIDVGGKVKKIFSGTLIDTI